MKTKVDGDIVAIIGLLILLFSNHVIVGSILLIFGLVGCTIKWKTDVSKEKQEK